MDRSRSKSTKRSRHELKRIVESIVREVRGLDARSLAFVVDELETTGRPIEQVRVWGTLHFLPRKDDFCCFEPGCHLWPFGDVLEEMSERLRSRLKLWQRVELEIVGTNVVVHEVAIADRGVV